MEKRKTGNAPFYAAMAVCLLAAGVGAWQLVRPGAGSGAAGAAGRDAVSTVSQLPAQTAPALPAAPPDGTGRGTGGQADTAPVSGTAAVPKEELSGPSSDTGAADTAPATASEGSGTDGDSGKLSGSTSDGGKTPSSGGGTSNGSSSSGGSSGSGKDTSSAARTSPLDGTAAAAFSMERLQYNKTLGDWRTHDGLDITADLGTAVAAACAGTVASVTEDPLMGVTVTLRHEGGYETTYAGLQETSREAGDEIPAGGILGTVGDTAAAEAYLGPHLHFSVRHGGVPMDPEEFLSGA